MRPRRGADNGTDDDDVNNVDNNDVNSRCQCHKTFFVVADATDNKLDRLRLMSLISMYEIFRVRLEPTGLQHDSCVLWQAPGLRPGNEILTITNALDYLVSSSVTSKKFCNFDTWGQCYKTFNVRYLRLSIVS